MPMTYAVLPEHYELALKADATRWADHRSGRPVWRGRPVYRLGAGQAERAHWRMVAFTGERFYRERGIPEGPCVVIPPAASDPSGSWQHAPIPSTDGVAAEMFDADETVADDDIEPGFGMSMPVWCTDCPKQLTDAEADRGTTCRSCQRTETTRQLRESIRRRDFATANTLLARRSA